MYNTYTSGGFLIHETSTKDQSLTFDRSNVVYIPKVFVVCDQRDTAPVWGYILRQRGLIVILETSRDKAIDRWSNEMPDLVVIDVDIAQEDRIELYNKFRAVSVAPILLFLPSHDETQVLEAYAAGVDEVVIKPIGPRYHPLVPTIVPLLPTSNQQDRDAPRVERVENPTRLTTVLHAQLSHAPMAG